MVVNDGDLINMMDEIIETLCEKDELLEAEAITLRRNIFGLLLEERDIKSGKMKETEEIKVLEE